MFKQVLQAACDSGTAATPCEKGLSNPLSCPNNKPSWAKCHPGVDAMRAAGSGTWKSGLSQEEKPSGSEAEIASRTGQIVSVCRTFVSDQQGKLCDVRAVPE